jgi:hypothetical protein
VRTKKRRLVGSLVVVVAGVFAACVAAGPETSTLFEALQVTYPSGAGSSWCGNPIVGSAQTCQDVTISPAVGDNYLLMSIDRSACTQNVWEPVLSTPIGSGYVIACAGSGGVDPAFAGSSVPTCVPTSYTFTARFSPSGPGPSSCVMSAVLMDRNTAAVTTAPINFNGLAVAPPVGLSISPASTFNFGQVPALQLSSAVTFAVKNSGSGSASISVTRNNPVWFPTTGLGSSFSLAAGSSQSFDVACQPQNAGSAAGSISFLAQSSGGSASQTLSLGCEGINSNIAINPSPAAFAAALVGSPPDNITITITAPSGSATLTGISLDSAVGDELSIVSGDNIGNGVGIGSSSSHEVVLKYTAQTSRPSGMLGNLVVTAQGGTPRSVAISGEALVGTAAIAPGVIDFGPVCANSTATETFEVYAEEAGSFNLMTYEAPSAPFSVTSTDFNPGVLLKGNHANAVMFTASVTPTEVNPTLSSTMTFQTNLPGGADVSLEMRAVALPPGVSPTPSRVDFGPNPVKATTFAQKIVLSNCGTSPTTITGVRIVGDNASEFAVVSPSNPLQTINMMDELELLVVMTPATPGAKVAQLEIVHDGGTAIANLDGAAFGDDELSHGEKDTYYACNVGGAAGLAPLGVAFLLLRRRRRRK